jgi:hypothetical protein
MLVESALSWDNEREVTALDWPPVLTPQLEETARQGAPRNAVMTPGEAIADIGFGDDGRIVIPADPDLTEAELRATSIDSLVGAAFLPSDAAAAANDVDFELERPRRSPRIKGPLILVGTAMTVALSAGYTANTLGWRLPPALLEAAHPVTTFFRDLSMPTFFRDLKTVRLVGLMEKLRLADPTNRAPSAEPEIVPSIVGPMSEVNEAASEPMSSLEDARVQDMMSAPVLASTLASDEGTPAPVREALVREVSAGESGAGSEPSRAVMDVLPGPSAHLASDAGSAAPRRAALVGTASHARYRAAAHKAGRF